MNPSLLSTHRGAGWPGRLLATLVVLALWAVPGLAQGVHVAFTPAYSIVQPGATFELDATVTQAGSAFNAFDVYVGFDPQALTLFPTSFTAQRGSLMTDACGSFFQDFKSTPDSLKCTLSFLCGGVSVTGPGQIYRLMFTASNTPQVTPVRFLHGLKFYNAGLFVLPDSSTDATVQIGALDGVGGPSRSGGSRVSVAPNPSRGDTQVHLESAPAGTQRLEVLDIAGRVVRRLQAGSFSGTPRTVNWDGRSDSGEKVSSGIYIVRFITPGGVSWTRSAIVR